MAEKNTELVVLLFDAVDKADKALDELKGLEDAGVLTAEEFDAAKQKLLAS